jgi:hypothetical protein
MTTRDLRTLSFLLLITLAAFSDNTLWRGWGLAMAQELSPPAAAPVARLESVERNDARTQQQLAQQIPIELVETPLADTLEYLSDVLGVQVYANWKPIEQAGVGPDSPISLNLKQVRGAMALELILDQAGADQLAYIIRDGVVIVSTISDLEGATMMRVYNCRDLLSRANQSYDPSAMGAPPGMGSESGYGEYGLEGYGGVALPGGGGYPGAPGKEQPTQVVTPTVSSPAGQRLVNILTSAVKPATWQSAGGVGSIAEYQGLIAVNHNARVHAQIEHMLQQLRKAARSDDGGRAATGQP